MITTLIEWNPWTVLSTTITTQWSENQSPPIVLWVHLGVSLWYHNRTETTRNLASNRVTSQIGWQVQWWTLCRLIKTSNTSYPLITQSIPPQQGTRYHFSNLWLAFPPRWPKLSSQNSALSLPNRTFLRRWVITNTKFNWKHSLKTLSEMSNTF